MQNGTKYKQNKILCGKNKGENERNEQNKKKMHGILCFFFNAISHDGDFVVDLSGEQCILLVEHQQHHPALEELNFVGNVLASR